MRIDTEHLRSFAKKACRNALGLNRLNSREGQILAKAETKANIRGCYVPKEIIFFVEDRGINVKTLPVSEDDLTGSSEIKVFDAVPKIEVEEHFREIVEEQMIEYAYNMTLYVLGFLNDF